MATTISARFRRLAASAAVAVAVAMAALSPGATAVALAGDTAQEGDRAAPAFSVLAAPSPVPATDMRRHLVYEIAVDNTTGSPVRLDGLEVRDASTERVLSAYRDDAITSLMVGLHPPTRTLAPGEREVLLIDAALAAERRAPARLEHRVALTLGAGEASARRMTITAARTGVDLRDPIRLGPPLRGPGLTVAGGCCSSAGGHRRALLEKDGRLVAAQRYAIDVVRIVDPLEIFAGDPARNDSYFVYGAEVIAAAFGRIVAARDGVPENTPPNPPPDPALDDLTGNFVTQDVGRGRFALYAHLQPGSVRVKPGEWVRPGQVLGLVGNSGNSTGPHLHFHVMDGPGGPSSLAADGLPYVFDRFELDGRVSGLESDPPALARTPADPPRRRAGQLPLTGDIMTLP
jgi:Peptidase family M23